jgi:hypothetical protein
MHTATIRFEKDFGTDNLSSFVYGDNKISMDASGKKIMAGLLNLS